MDFEYNPPTNPYLDILYRDDDIAVCNKPSGLLSVRGRAPEHQDSLQSRAQTVWPELGIVHRLDMDTSGIIVLALHKEALRRLSSQFQNRKTEKTYIANVWGIPDEDEGTIELPLICDWPNRPKQKVCYEYGKSAKTHWKVINNQGNITQVELTPITGRTHQLRVHLAEIGHPIIGDRFYASGQALDAVPRLNLHAIKLGFHHPMTEQSLCFESPPQFEVKKKNQLL